MMSMLDNERKVRYFKIQMICRSICFVSLGRLFYRFSLHFFTRFWFLYSSPALIKLIFQAMIWRISLWDIRHIARLTMILPLHDTPPARAFPEDDDTIFRAYLYTLLSAPHGVMEKFFCFTMLPDYNIRLMTVFFDYSMINLPDSFWGFPHSRYNRQAKIPEHEWVMLASAHISSEPPDIFSRLPQDIFDISL